MYNRTGNSLYSISGIKYFITEVKFFKIEFTWLNLYFAHMKKIKIPVKKKRTNREDYSKYNFEDNFRPKKILRIIFYCLVIIIPILFSLNYLLYAIKLNRYPSFPLDDPWIHLTFAKNLFEYFSFSYFKDQMVTAGSTSPLYTFILSIMFFFSNNEMYISYILGIAFFALASFSFYKLANVEFDNQVIFSLLCTLVFIIDKWMNFISVSGMETTMYILILILCAYFYRKRSAVPFAVMLGLILWTRPDGVAFIFALIVDYILVKLYSKNQINLLLFTAADLKKIVIIFGGIIGLYFLMNFYLSGSLLPNTYNAKLTYYSPEFRSRLAFLNTEVWEYFKYSSYYVVMIGFLLAVVKLIFDIYKKTYNQNTLYIVFILALIFIYWLKLPYAHRFGRYMMPIIPFFILVASIGFRDFAFIVNKYTNNALFAKSIFYIWFGIIYFMGIKIYDETKELYVAQCKYIYDRQVMAAKFLEKNTVEGDVIATHDVGAIGFYSGRKIVDVAGLVTPELIKKINDENYVDYMTKYLDENKVTYLAFLREWYRVSNQTPLFTTANDYPPEVMDVFKYIPGSTHILSREANGLIMNAQTLANQKAAQQMFYILDRVQQIEPNASIAYYLRAYACSLNNDGINYEKNMLKAIELYPDFRDAHLYYGIFLKDNGRYDEAMTELNKVLELDPKNKNALANIKLVEDKINAAKQEPLK